MFDHLEFTVSDIVKARAFYGGITAALGWDELFFDADGKELGIGQGNVTHLLLMQGAPTQPSVHLCFKAAGKDSVQHAYDAAIKAGGTCNGPPGYRDHYGPGYFAAFIHDVDGHNVEILFREN